MPADQQNADYVYRCGHVEHALMFDGGPSGRHLCDGWEPCPEYHEQLRLWWLAQNDDGSGSAS